MLNTEIDMENIKGEEFESLLHDNDKREALTLFQEIADCSSQLCDLIGKLKTKFDQKEMSIDKGISLVDVKNALILQYLENLTYFMMLKSCGKQIEGNSVIERLIELRVVLERIRPIEQKLKYQMDKMVKMALTGSVNENDPSRFKANPANMLSKAEDEGSASESDDDDGGEDNQGKNKSESTKERRGIYIPPKIAAVHYDGDKVEKKTKALERARKYALNSSVLQELKEEYLDTPMEIATTNSARQTHDRQQKRKQEFEETYFTRLPITKEERKRGKKLSTLGTLGDEVTRFEDISVLNGGELRSSKKRKRTKSTKKKGKSSGGKKKRRK